MVGGVGALSMEEFDLKYQSVLRDGKAMVAVAVDGEEDAGDARRLLEKEGPEDIHMIDGQGERIGGVGQGRPPAGVAWAPHERGRAT